MSEKFLCLMATFDEETSERMKGIEGIINEVGIVGKQTPNLPHHITLGLFDVDREDEIKELIKDVSAKINSFDLSFNHVGLFGLEVMFLAPNVNHELLELHEKFEGYSMKDGREWTPHATILIDEAENIQKALPLVAENFQQFKGRVESLRLYEFF